LEHKAKIDLKNNNGTDALYIATWKQQKEIVKALIKHHAPVDTKGINEGTPLMMAYNKKNYYIFALLAHHSKDTLEVAMFLNNALNTDDKLILNALHQAGVSGNVAIGGWTGLQVACKKGNLTSVKMLLQCGAQINTKTAKGHFPIHIAARHTEDTQIIELLVTAGANVNSTDFSGYTALHIACKMEKYNIVKYLLNIGAKNNIKNKHRKIPSSLTNNTNILSLFGNIKGKFIGSKLSTSPSTK